MAASRKALQRLISAWVLGVVLMTVFPIREAAAAPFTAVREYTYRAGDADSKLTSRTMALEQVKRLLLEELGTYLVSNTVVKEAELTKDEIVTYTAGAVVTIILEERWNGEEYYLKAQITADSDEVAKSVAAMHEDREKAAELAQLRAQASESLKEIERLRKELSDAKSTAGPDTTNSISSVQKDYNQAVARLTAKDYLEQGIQLQRTGTFAEVEATLGKAIASAPYWYRPYVARAAAYLLVNQPEKAQADLEHAIKLNRSDITAGNLHGIVLLKLGRADDGLAEFQRVAAAAPNDLNMHTNIGGVLYKNNMLHEALPFLSHSIELHADDQGRSYFLRAQVYSQLGVKQRALDDLRMAAQLGNKKAHELLR